MTVKPGCRAEDTSTNRHEGRHANAFGGPAGKGRSLNCTPNVSLLGLGGALTRQIVENAHKRCPFSNATRGNVDLALNLV
ncbi:OsmC family protein [Martelella soudanensis]|uniref:hypothetical protein n=1 Tax=unclassified Martelella TaxID=2629616 RepID=UPI0015DE34C9|nr:MULTISPECIES: hypothetical protein [unclassified Martelella]